MKSRGIFSFKWAIENPGKIRVGSGVSFQPFHHGSLAQSQLKGGYRYSNRLAICTKYFAGPLFLQISVSFYSGSLCFILILIVPGKMTSKSFLPHKPNNTAKQSMAMPIIKVSIPYLLLGVIEKSINDKVIIIIDTISFTLSSGVFNDLNLVIPSTIPVRVANTRENGNRSIQKSKIEGTLYNLNSG